MPPQGCRDCSMLASDQLSILPQGQGKGDTTAEDLAAVWWWLSLLSVWLILYIQVYLVCLLRHFELPILLLSAVNWEHSLWFTPDQLFLFWTHFQCPCRSLALADIWLCDTSPSASPTLFYSAIISGVLCIMILSEATRFLFLNTLQLALYWCHLSLVRLQSLSELSHFAISYSQLTKPGKVRMLSEDLKQLWRYWWDVSNYIHKRDIEAPLIACFLASS